MSLKVDVGKSEQFRTDGNASFKKGKWVEAIGHYTNAILYNPQDPTAYSNRAQAFLKLDKFNDAERDCTTVLSLEKGRNNVKALYRRSLARKGLSDHTGAIQDIEEVLRLDKDNQVAQAEYEELKGMRSAEEAKKKTPRRPLSPPTLPKQPENSTSKVDQLGAKANSLNISGDQSAASTLSAEDGNGQPRPDDDVQPDSTSKALPVKDRVAVAAAAAMQGGIQGSEEVAPSRSFASMRQAREGKKKAYAGSSSSAQSTVEALPQSTSTSVDQIETSSFKPSDARVTATTMTGTSPKPAAPSPARPLSSAPSHSSQGPTEAETDSPPTLPSHVDTTSTLPGSGLQLLRYLSPSSSPASNYAILSLYPPANIPKILSALLEPDNLGLILLALDFGIRTKSVDQKNPSLGMSGVKEIIMGLKKTKRWGMNVAMLSREERQAGERVWEACGAAQEGSFR
ncbi:hypothetical protein I316_05189 [Kwoniella heveanensis BCC8398]|uniref:RNA polymerase II-associated protein 3 n=1 Tax=Kwoniella heveanensis BCC8398 TaxID=1296120 RepID=A0A1B9GPX0_9TREE|nr:hypothetical protein I316_05189 [Kwoniella heveanensis BCC8398]